MRPRLARARPLGQDAEAEPDLSPPENRSCITLRALSSAFLTGSRWRRSAIALSAFLPASLARTALMAASAFLAASPSRRSCSALAAFLAASVSRRSLTLAAACCARAAASLRSCAADSLRLRPAVLAEPDSPAVIRVQKSLIRRSNSLMITYLQVTRYIALSGRVQSGSKPRRSRVARYHHYPRRASHARRRGRPRHPRPRLACPVGRRYGAVVVYAARLTVLGSLNMDISVTVPELPVPGATVLGTAAVFAPGGKGANQAVAAARLAGDAGMRVAMVGCTGDDDFGRTLREALRAEGIDDSRVRTVVGAPTGIAMITVDHAGENMITVAPGANHEVTPADAALAAPDPA